jgi:hypothetical protein
MIAQAFRDDLYYRLAEIVVKIGLAERAGRYCWRAASSAFAREMNPRSGPVPDARKLSCPQLAGNVRSWRTASMGGYHGR